MNEQLRYMADELAIELTYDLSDPNLYFDLSARGEAFRRAYLFLDEDNDVFHKLIEHYETQLKSWNPPQLEAIQSRIEDALDKIKAYAQEPIGIRDDHKGKNRLETLDAALSVLSAATRLNQHSIDDLQRLSVRVSSELEPYMAQLSDLFTFAYQRSQIIDLDPLFPKLFQFWEDLADLSLEAVEYEQAFERVAAMERIAFPNHVEEYVVKKSPSFIERLMDKVGRMKELIEVSLPTPAAVAAYDDQSLSSLEVIHEFEEGLVALLREKNIYTLRIQESYLDEAHLVANDQTVEGMRLDEQAFSFTLVDLSDVLKLEFDAIIDQQKIIFPTIIVKIN